MSKATELINILNTTMKKSTSRMASDEVYKSGFWSTGYVAIDAVLGGGWAKGRMGLLEGESATLKSLIGLATAGKVQQNGGVSAYIDLEHSFNQEWASRLGVDIDELLLLRPQTGEEAIDQAEVLLRNDIDFICFDSIAALLPRSEQELMLSGKDHNQPANTARLMSLALRKLNSANDRTTILWITQMRDNIGGLAFAPRTNATGGKAKHFYVSQELMLRKTGKVYETVTYYNGDKDDTDKVVVAQNFKAELLKSRFGQPFVTQYFVFDLQGGGEIDNLGYLVQQGLDIGIITRNKAWWNVTIVDDNGVVVIDEKAGSKDKFRELVNNSTEIQTHLLKTVCDRYGLEPNNYGFVRDRQN